MRSIKKILSALLVLIFLFGAFPFGMAPVAGASNSYSDVSGHWAAGSINRLNSLGFLDPDIFPGPNFSPNKYITRVEFFSLLTKAMGAAAKSDLAGFSDVGDLPSYERDVVALANQMGIAFGNTDGTMRPHSNLLRQDAATLAARSLGMSSVADWTLSHFNDGTFISSYARTYVASFIEKGLMVGYPGGDFRPSANITRAESARIIDNLFTHIYQPETGFLNVYLQGNLLIQAHGAELRDCVIDGDVIVGDGVGDGNVAVSNCTINGRLIVRGGGPNSVTLSETVVSEGIYVASFSVETRIAVADNSTVPKLEAVSGFMLSGSGVPEVTILENAREKAVVNLNGVSPNDLNINGSGVEVRLNSGHAINARFDASSSGSTLVLAANTSVGHLTINAPNASVTGSGVIRNLLINNAGANVAPVPELMTLGVNVNAVVGGLPVSSAESQWSNTNIDRVSSNSSQKVELLTNTSALAPFNQATLNLSMVAGSTASEAHVTQAAASRVPLTQRNNRWGYWVGFFVPAPSDAGSMATLTYTYVDGDPITLPPKPLDTYSGRKGLLIYLPVFREPGKETGLLKELLFVNWGGHLTENIHFMSSTMHLASLNAAEQAMLQKQFDERVMYSILGGATPYSGAEATRRILNSDNPLGLPSKDNRGLEAINRAVSSTEARNVLEDQQFAAGLTIDTSGNSQYSALSDAGKTWVAEQVLAARKTAYATPSAVKAAFDKAVQTRLASETALLGQVNNSPDFAALRKIIEIAANAATLQFQTGADPYKSYTNSQKDAMADYLWRLRQYRSLQDVIDAIKKYLGDPTNAPGDGGGSSDIRDMQIQRLSVTVTPNTTSVPSGQTRILNVVVDLVGGKQLTAAQVGSLIEQGVIIFQWDNPSPSPSATIWPGAVGNLERTGPNTFRFTSTNLGLDPRNRTDKITFTLTDANNKKFTAAITFTAPQFISATGITRVAPEQAIIFVGQSVQFQAVLTPSNTTETARWSCNPPSIISVSDNGLVTGLSPGVATVTARIESGETKDVQVRVFRDADDVIVDPVRVILTPGGSTVVTAYTATPGRQVIWTSNDPRITVTQSGNTATITAIRGLIDASTLPEIIKDAVTARVVGILKDASSGSASVEVELRASTGIIARLSRGSIMFAGDPQLNYILTSVEDDAMMSQKLYVQVEQVEPEGIAPAARFVGGDRTPVRVGDPIGIQASNTGIGKVRIMLSTDPDGRGDLVAELFVVVAPRSEAVTFWHTGTTGTWYPGTNIQGEGQRVPAGVINPDPTGYGPVLTMQINDRPTVTPRTSGNRALSGMSWGPYISNQHREVLYQIRTDADGVILDRFGFPIANPDPSNGFGDPLQFERVFVYDGGPYGKVPDPTDPGKFLPAGYEFHYPRENGTSRLGFFKNETAEPEDADDPPAAAVPRSVRLAVLRGGSVDRVTTQMLTATNGNLIPNNTQPTGLAAVIMSPPRNSMLAADAKVWGDLFFIDTVDLFVAGKYNPVISQESGFILWERVANTWVEVPPTPAGRDIYTMTEQEVRDGLYRITDINGTADESENGLWGRVTAILIGDPNYETNTFYIRLLPNPINRPEALIRDRVPWRPPVFGAMDHIKDIMVQPGSRDAYDYRSPTDVTDPLLPGYRELDYPFMGAEYIRVGGTTTSSMSVTYLDGVSYYLFVKTQYPDEQPTVDVTYTYRYSVFQWSKWGFAPMPGGIGLGEGRQFPVQSMSYTPQVTTPLVFELTIYPPSQPSATVFSGIEVPLLGNPAVSRALALADISDSEFLALPPGAFDFSPADTETVFNFAAKAVTFKTDFETQYTLTITANSKVATVLFNVVVLPPVVPGSITLDPGFVSIVGLSVPAIELPGVMAAATDVGIAPMSAVVDSSDPAMLEIDAASGIATPRKPGKVNVTVRERQGYRSTIVGVRILPEGGSNPSTGQPPGEQPGQTAPDPNPNPTPTPNPTPAPNPNPTPTPTPTPSVVNPTALSLRATASVTLNGTVRLEPYVTPANADKSTLRWSSSDTSVATVNAGGLVTGLKAGSAKITVTDSGGSLRAECTVSVKADAKPVTSISLSKQALTLNAGAVSTLTVSYVPSNATIRSVTWSSNNAAVAKVDANGRVTAVSGGTATITATSDSGSLTASCTVTVRVPVTSVTLPELRVTLKVGDTYQLNPIITPVDATDKTVTFTSKSTAIVTVASDGLVTAIKAGSTTITIKADGKAITCAVTVVK